MIRPIHDYVLIEMKPLTEKSEGGILFPEKAQKQEMAGIVVDIGPGFENQHGNFTTMQVKKDDRVVLSPTPNAIKYKDYYLVRQGDIVAIVEE